MLIFDIKWIAPIRISLLDDDETIVEGPVQALALLRDDWPAPGGKHHRTAVQECNAACQALGRSEKAREAFMAAALEAGVLIFGGDARRARAIVAADSEMAKGYALPI